MSSKNLSTEVSFSFSFLLRISIWNLASSIYNQIAIYMPTVPQPENLELVSGCVSLLPHQCLLCTLWDGGASKVQKSQQCWVFVQWLTLILGVLRLHFAGRPDLALLLDNLETNGLANLEHKFCRSRPSNFVFTSPSLKYDPINVILDVTNLPRNDNTAVLPHNLVWYLFTVLIGVVSCTRLFHVSWLCRSVDTWRTVTSTLATKPWFLMEYMDCLSGVSSKLIIAFWVFEEFLFKFLPCPFRVGETKEEWWL